MAAIGTSAKEVTHITFQFLLGRFKAYKYITVDDGRY
jgi:hypothetical protein